MIETLRKTSRGDFELAYFVHFVFLAVLFAAYAPFLIQRNPFLFMDLGADQLHGQLPVIIGIKNHFIENGFNIFSFQIALGDSVLSQWMFFLDPFSILLSFFKIELIPYAIIYFHVFKMALTYGTFYLFLSEAKLSRTAAAIGSLFFSFSGYLILWGQFMAWSTGILYFAVTLYGLERMLRQKKGTVLIGSLFLFSASSLYFLFMSFFFFGPYALIKITLGEERCKFRFFLRLLACALIGIGLSSFISIPMVFEMLSSPRVGGQLWTAGLWHESKMYVAMALRFFGNSYQLGTCNHISGGDFGWSSLYNLPCLYVGSLFPFAIADVLNGKASSKFRLVSLVFGILFVIFFLFRFMSSILHGLSEPTFRWSFIFTAWTALSIAVLVFRLQTVDERLSRRRVVGTWAMVVAAYAIVLGASLTIFECPNTALKTLSLNFIYPLFLTLNAALLFFADQIPRILLIVAITSVSGAELALMARRDNLARDIAPPGFLKSGPNSYFNPGTDLIKAAVQSDPSFFRIGKSYLSTGFNDPMAEGFRGLTGYSSLQNKNTLAFLNLVLDRPILAETASAPPNWVIVPNSHPLLSSFLNTKYFLGLNPKDHPFGYTQVAEKGGHFIFENKYAFPMGLMYYDAMSMPDFQRLPSEQKDLAVLQNLISSRGRDPSQIVSTLGEQETRLSTGSEIIFSGARGSIEKRQNRIKFQSLGSDPYFIVEVSERAYYRRLKIKAEIFSPENSFLQIFWADDQQSHSESQSKTWDLQRGRHAYTFEVPIASSLGSLRFDLGSKPIAYEVTGLQILGVKADSPEDLFTKNWDSLSGRFAHLKWQRPTGFSGSINVPRDGTLLMQIPYSTGWTAQVDGAPTNVDLVQGGLVGLPLKAGFHHVQFDYRLPGRTIGIWMTLFFVVLGGCLLLLSKTPSNFSTAKFDHFI